jgi:hypothetical protein
LFEILFYTTVRSYSSFVIGDVMQLISIDTLDMLDRLGSLRRYCAKAFSVILLALCGVALSACDRLGMPDPAKEAAQHEADARATGSACRHAGRGIEDCYALNPDASRAAVYAGWKDMNDYMRENKIDEVKPSATSASHPAVSATASATSAAHSSAEASAAASAKR